MRQFFPTPDPTQKLVRFLAHSRQYAQLCLKTPFDCPIRPIIAPYLPSGIFFNPPRLGRFRVFLGFPVLCNLLFGHRNRQCVFLLFHSNTI